LGKTEGADKEVKAGSKSSKQKKKKRDHLYAC